ncbi:MAG: N-acetyltransferase [candidate division Zixibacteria bacterium]|nr:N-acetyltransferase [candidate division Zixibacteria bacterium]
MPKIEIVEVESTSQLKQFITYPNRLYKDDPNYVTPLLSERLEFFDKEKNPFFHSARVKLFLAMNGKEVTGRIATCINFNHNDFHSEQVGFFGFFDCPDDYEIASTLLKVAMITIKREKMEKMRGPMNFSTNHECGFLIEGFDTPPTVMMAYNQPYLPQLAEKFGLKKAMDLVAYNFSDDISISPRIVRVVEKIAARSKITMRNLNVKDFDNEIKRINKIYNQAWEKNWGFVPMTEDEFVYTAKNLRQIVDPDIAFICESGDMPVAFCLALPDINQALIHLKGKLMPLGLLKLLWHTKIHNKIDCARAITFGVIPQFQKLGLEMLMYSACFKKVFEKGYHRGEASWVLETNDLMRKAIEEMGGTLYKRYRIVEMPL